VNGYDISCERLTSLTPPFLDGTLTEVAKRIFEQHLVFCDECRLNLVRTRRAIAILHTLPHAEPPEELVARVVARLRAST
jgi:anti-sigma factor RsiW